MYERIWKWGELQSPCAYSVRNTFCCARHNPNAKTFTHRPAGLPQPGSTPLHSFLNRNLCVSCFKNKGTITGQVQSERGGRGEMCWRSQKSLKLNLVMDHSLFSLTRIWFLNTFYALTSYTNIKILEGKYFCLIIYTLHKCPLGWKTSPAFSTGEVKFHPALSLSKLSNLELRLSISFFPVWWRSPSQTLLFQTHKPNKNKSSVVQTALIPLTAFQPVPLKVIMGYKYASFQG